MNQRHFRIGLTGSIGMGKSTVLAFFAAQGLPTWDADAAVARLYAPGAVGSDAIKDIAPECVSEAGVDRACLSRKISEDPGFLKDLEDVIHPLVAADRQAFSASVDAWAAVYDIPLLFETNAQDQYDAVVVVSASSDVQKSRVLARPGMTEQKLDLILARQLPDSEKRARADVVIDTERPLKDTEATVRSLVKGWKENHA